ncbi:hypothetical protein [Actinocatenispora sera]|uniref:DUF2530 domain-containing protein n=1 Tax=Actinocatenispora sera TaxID=390989 RepID=A0A810LBK6_9ACTN|nr:hypothetical protein [Actinocatenispora sera]BCJ31641.1 hypothetical protein Asera_57490 [Actinocatenispora sera]
MTTKSAPHVDSPTEKNYPHALAGAVSSALLGAAIAWIIAFVVFAIVLDDVSTSSWPAACAALAGAGTYIGKWVSLKISKRS